MTHHETDVVGAVLASFTNLIFIGLVKSGKPLDMVDVQVGDKHYKAQPDEVGYWKVKVPSSTFDGTKQIDAKAGYALQGQQAESIVRVQPLVTTHAEHSPIQILPLMGSDQITAKSSEGMLLFGQYFGKALSPNQEL